MARILSDWIENYIAVTENLESPVIYDLWCALTAISSAIGGACHTNWGLRGYIYPNMYVCLVGPPAGRKGTAINIAKKMVHCLNTPIGSDAVASTQALYRELSESEKPYLDTDGKLKSHRSLAVWSEEFRVFLSERDPDFIPAVTDIFDCPERWKYSSETKGVVDLSNCYLTIMGAITPEMLQARLSRSAVGGGLLSRIILVVGHGPEKRIAKPLVSKKDAELFKNLIHDLKEISNLCGPFLIEEFFLKVYTEWYESSSYDDGVINQKLLGYNGRRALHLTKLCMIICASESDDMVLLPHHFEKALAILELTEKGMGSAFQCLSVGGVPTETANILAWIEDRERFEWDEILNKFRMLPHQLNEVLKIAEHCGLVKIQSSATKTVYFVQIKNKKGGGMDYLNKTVFSLLSENSKKE